MRSNICTYSKLHLNHSEAKTQSNNYCDIVTYKSILCTLLSIDSSTVWLSIIRWVRNRRVDGRALAVKHSAENEIPVLT